jgi:hypothetical protein
MEKMWRQGIDTLAKVFCDDVAEMIGLFQDYLYNLCQCNSVKDQYPKYPQFISVAGQKLDPYLFTDILKKNRRVSRNRIRMQKAFFSIT